jgi:hypothetical protein
VIKEAHAGVTGDKTHDSYSMRFFVAKVVKTLRNKGVMAGNKITVLCVHLKNAAQHFKSSKSLYWLSRQLFEMGFTPVLWDFGPPGHGIGDTHTHTHTYTRYSKRPSANSIFPESKHCHFVLYDIGKWDGLGGMLKQWIRQRAQSLLQVSGTKVTIPKVATTSGLMASALDCFEAWQSFRDGRVARARYGGEAAGDRHLLPRGGVGGHRAAAHRAVRGS